MVALAANGLSVDLPRGWDGQIRAVEPTPAASPGAHAESSRAAGSMPVILHAGSFPLPAERGDYGSGAVEVMGGSDILLCLLEHEPEAVDTALFRRRGIPRLQAEGFSPQAMQRAIPGMAGSQHFFQLAGRPFCLYVVIGSYRTRGPLVRVADDVARSIRVDG